MYAIWLLFVVVVVAQAGSSAKENPFTGSWTADLSQSKLHPNSPVRSATLQFVVAGDSVSITDRVVTTAGQQVGHGTTVFQTDGKEHSHDELMPGLVVTAQWRDSHLLEMILKRPGHVDRVTYEVSPDGKTLTNRTAGNLGEQVIVFHRQ